MSALKICPQCGTEYELDQRFCPKDGSTLRSQSGGNGDLVGQIIADRYHVLKKLGEGGMGQVYLAEHVKMGRRSAVKVMNPGMVHDADAISRFNREASNASRINHPNVAAIYDFGETTDGLIYLAMEFVEGEPLTKVIERQGALPAARAADITHQAADALSVAHDLGIVHRDLKPDNIMIGRKRDGTDLVKVVDFGIAKAGNAEGQKVTKTGLVVGTPEYMSPEQLAGDKLDGRSDIYSLGLVSFNMLTGKLPFPSETVQEAMIMRLTDRPRTLAEMKPDVAWPPELQAVMDKVLCRDCADRYQTAAEFGRDIMRAVEKMPQTQVADLGTMVVGAAAVPPTRVAGAAAGAAGAGATQAAAPAQRPSARPPAPAPKKSNKAALIGGGVLVAALAAGGIFAFVRKSTGVTPDTARVAQHDSASTARDSATMLAANDSSAVAPAPVSPPNTGTKTTTTKTTTPNTTVPLRNPTNVRVPGRDTSRRNATTPASGTGVEVDMAQISSLAGDPATAQQAVNKIRTVMQQLPENDPQRLELIYHRGEAFGVLDKSDQMCRDMRLVRRSATGTLKKQADAYFQPLNGGAPLCSAN